MFQRRHQRYHLDSFHQLRSDILNRLDTSAVKCLSSCYHRRHWLELFGLFQAFRSSLLVALFRSYLGRNVIYHLPSIINRNYYPNHQQHDDNRRRIYYNCCRSYRSRCNYRLLNYRFSMVFLLLLLSLMA